MLEAALKFSKDLKNARLKTKPVIDLIKHENDFKEAEIWSNIHSVKLIINKIKRHGKDSNKKS